MANAKPKCPACGLEGAEHIVATSSAQRAQGGDTWFEIAHCDGCGHVYGVFTKVVHSRHVEMPKA